MSGSAGSSGGSSSVGSSRASGSGVEMLRHPMHTRILHWCVAICFILSLLSGFAIYSPWLFTFLAPLFGGGAMTRFLHPWFSLAFVIVFCLQIINWLAPMAWTAADTRWLRTMRDYVTNAEVIEHADVGFFNAGQKLYFWTIVGCALLFLVSGIPMWFPVTFGRTAVAVGYVLHDIAALGMLGGFFIHIYEATFGQPGTFRSMTRGTVTRRWAWTHHPAWYRAETGRDPRADYDRAVSTLAAREQAARLPAVRRDKEAPS
jgi:formate dehydrogenase subunit gamma